MNNPRAKPWIRWSLIGLALVASVAMFRAESARENDRFHREMTRLVYQSSWEAAHLTQDEADAQQSEALHPLGRKAGRWLLKELRNISSPPVGWWSRLRQFRLALLRQRPPPAKLDLYQLMSAPGGLPPGILRRQQILKALTLMGKEASVSTRDLLDLTNDADVYTRRMALELLGENGDASPTVIASLTQFSRGPVVTQATAAISLFRLQPTNTWALETANECLAGQQSIPRTHILAAVGTLRRLGAAARPFIPGLKRALAGFQTGLSDLPPARQFDLILHSRAMAAALWRIEGTPEGALVWFQESRRLRAASQPALHPCLDIELIELARETSESPEFCRAVRPVLEEMRPRPGPALADALRRIDQTLGTVANAAVVKRQKPKDQ